MPKEFEWTDDTVYEFLRYLHDLDIPNSPMNASHHIIAFRKKMTEPQPLFISTDGSKIYPGVHYWTVDEKFHIQREYATENSRVSCKFRVYSHEKAAVEYVKEHKPLYSKAGLRQLHMDYMYARENQSITPLSIHFLTHILTNEPV